jgi:DNA invertase Pin-like site-specific DNA recombinase
VGNERAIIYCRVSGEGQKDNSSLPEQQERAAGHCAMRNYQVLRVISEVHSGNDLDERDGIWEICKAIERGEVDVVVQTVIDRMSRNLRHQEVLFYTAD